MNDVLIDVPGARLRCRLTGESSNLPLLVFENGWGASYEQWAWIEHLLAPRTRLLFYDRAGVGGSSINTTQTVAGLSAGFAALLAALKIDSPVVVVGHSYGGLMGSLHLAQQPQLLRALVQIDATPDRPDDQLDPQLKAMQWVGALSILLARLGWPNPVFGPAGKMLPAPSGGQMMQHAFGRAGSLKASMTELALLDEIRQAIATQSATRPALIISAGRVAETKGLMARLAPPQKARVLRERMQSLHQQKASLALGEWDQLPHDHGGLVFSEAGARASAERLMAFVQKLVQGS